MARNKNVKDLLSNSLPSAPQQEVQSAGDRVFERLQSDSDRMPTRAVMEFKHAHRGGRHWVPVMTIAAAIAIAVLVPVKLHQRGPAVLEDVAGARKIEFGEVVRSTGGASETLVLADGSRVEMRAKSELLLERADDGVRIHLRNGGIIVNAARQRTGHLYVQTKDVTVSVVGTVFLVNAEEEGSRVAVIEGEVHVQQQGTAEKKLGPGEQVATNPKMESLAVKEEVSWSRDALAHVAMLQQAPAPTSKDERVAFEVATIRPAAPPPLPGPTARSGGGGPGSAMHCPMGRGALQLDPRRFSIRNVSVYGLVAMAYGACEYLEGRPLGERPARIVSGPEWIKSDGWDIEGLIPEGSDPLPTNRLGGFVEELRMGRSPKIQTMIRTLLEERFKVVVRREMREMPVYVLTVGPNGTKFQSKDWMGFLNAVYSPGPDWVPPPGADTALRSSIETQPCCIRGGANLRDPDPADPWVRQSLMAVAQGASGMSRMPNGRCLDSPGYYGNPGQRILKANDKDCGLIIVANQFMNITLLELADYVRRPILDRTGIQDRVSFAIDWPAQPFVPGQFASPISFQEFSKALAPVGLQVKEDPKGLVEFFVIERAEKPSEN